MTRRSGQEDHPGGMALQAERLLDQGKTYQRLAAQGRLISATLLGLRDTGGGLDGDPELELELAVVLDGTRKVVHHRQVVSRLAARELRLGSSLPVRVDPLDHSTMALA